MNRKHTERAAAAAMKQSGFTLVELMVVVAIIAILATIVGINVLGRVDDANKTAAAAQIKTFKTALIGYKLKFKKFPQSLDELSSSGMIEGKVPVDPWGNAYAYSAEGSKFTIVSYGADGRPGGQEDAADISSDSLESINKN